MPIFKSHRNQIKSTGKIESDIFELVKTLKTVKYHRRLTNFHLKLLLYLRVDQLISNIMFLQFTF